MAAGCGGGRGGGGEVLATARTSLAAAQARWTAAGVRDYHFTYNTVCFCPPREDARVVVRAGAVVSATWQPSGTALTADELAQLPTVEGLFGKVAAACDQQAVQVQASYDPRLGYPESIWVDYWANVADDEMGWRLKDFGQD